jgi:hypothetical protein
VRALIERGLMQPSGIVAFNARRENRSGIYSYEQRSTERAKPYAERLRKSRLAFHYFSAPPASYRKAAVWWAVSAKQEAARLRRLEPLFEDSVSEPGITQFVPAKLSNVHGRPKEGGEVRHGDRRQATVIHFPSAAGRAWARGSLADR